MHESLRRALTFHAPFADGPDATFGGGDRTLYSISDEGALTPGPGRLTIDRTRGGLRFSRERTDVVGFRARGNIRYAADSFRGTVVLTMSLDPAAIPSRYCDPLQITDKKYSDSCIWLDFTKNDDPPDLRLGIFGERGGWDVAGRESDSQEFYFRLLKVALPPFAADRWTQVAIVWDGLNTGSGGRGHLYFDAQHQGATGLIRERMVWDEAQTMIRLGTGQFVGLMRDLALFDRPLSDEELRLLAGSSVRDLY